MQHLSQLGHSLAGRYSALNPEPDAGVLQTIEKLDDFSQNRFRCITNPQHARSTLTPYSILELQIKRGRDLLDRDFGLLRAHDTTADAFVEVWRDDHKLDNCVTETARGKQQPSWDYTCQVEVLAPQSMLRLQVVDDVGAGTKNDIGFVELAIGDIPFDTDIEGWFELRFQENMVRTSVVRYRKHCQQREEVITDQATQEAAAVEKKQKELATKSVNETMQLAEEGKLDERKEKFATQKEQAVTPLSACMQSTADKANELGLETVGQTFKGAATTRMRKNAGELYMKIKLRRIVSWSDALFAQALSPEPPVQLKGGFEAVVVPEAADFQLCCEEIWEFKAQFLDDAVFCIMYWLRYLVIWRSSLLSFVHLVGFLTVCWFNFTLWAILPLLAAIDLVVNYFESVRMPMTRGGRNAPFTDAGFAWTAAWRSTPDMQAFLVRFATFDMKCTVVDEPSLRAFAALCFRDGVPTVNIEDLRTLLQSRDFLKPNEKAQKPYVADEPVWVDDKLRAKVVKPGPGKDQVTVVFDTVGAGGQQFQQPPQTLDSLRVCRRYTDIGVPHFAVQTAAGRIIRRIFPDMMRIKEALRTPVRVITDILIWKNCRTTFGLVLALLLASALFSTAAVLYLMDKVSEAGKLGDAMKLVVRIIRHVDNVAIMFAAFVVVLTQSWWFYGFRSILRILASASNTRRAPKNWAFFTSPQQTNSPST